MDFPTLLSLIGGLLVLTAGAEILVRGASRLAASMGISPLVVGLTVVAFGTSAPELAISLKSSLTGQSDLAVGNVVGSNVFNVLLILGACALIAPLVVAQQLVRRDVPLMIGLSLLVLGFGLDGSVGRAEGVLLVAGLVAYTTYAIRCGRRESAAVEAEYAREFAAPPKPRWALQIGAVLAGLALLVLGARWFVTGAVEMARWLGLSEAIIGLTIVAAGTSLPEVATSILATVRGERDIAVGNVVGSNLFNLMGVLGLTAALTPGGLPVAPSIEAFDLPVMAAVAVACLPIFFTGRRIDRWEGAIFLGYYAAYLAYLVLAATEHDALHGYSAVMAWFVMPLTGLTLAVWVARALREPAS